MVTSKESVNNRLAFHWKTNSIETTGAHDFQIVGFVLISLVS